MGWLPFNFLTKRAGNGGGAAYHPTDDWTDAELFCIAEADYLTTDTGISVWENLGTIGGDFRQATGTKQPTFAASDANFGSNGSLNFDGTDDFMALRNEADSADVPMSDVITVSTGLLLVVARSDIAADATQRALIAEDSQNVFIHYGNDADGPFYCRAWSGSYGSDASIGGASETTCIAAAVHASAALTGYLNATAQTPVVKNDLSSIGDGVVLGGLTSSLFFNGQISMVVAMKTIPGDLVARLTSLMTYYGIS